MANEFIIKRGFESKGSSQVTGSLSVSSNIIADGTIAGSNISGTNTGDQDLSALALKTAISGAFNAPSASFSTRVTDNVSNINSNLTKINSLASVTSSYASKSAISGSFTAPSSSFSTRVTFLEEGGAVGFTASGISGSLGPNATLIRSLTATGISGSSTESSASFSTRVSSLETKSVFSGSLSGNGSDINSINASNISSGTIAAARVATLNQNTTGNAATATKLATARTINGVSFDGSADITTVEGNTGVTGDTLNSITIGGTDFTVSTGTGAGNVETSGTPLDNDYAKFTSGYQIEGRSTSEVKTDLSLNNVENTALSTYTGNGGALDNQYIANGRGFALKTAISGAFVASSASFSTRVTGNALGMSTNASNISSNTSNITSNASNITNNRSLITGITSSLDTVGRMVFVGSNGTLTSEAGFAYNATTNQLSVDSLNVIHLTSSFITSSNIKTSGSNIFGDSTSDTQTFIGTTFISGAAQITGSLGVSANIKSSGTVIGSNLSGTNTGDQDLSALALKTAISGSFTAPSSSFSTRVTLNDAKLTANTTNVTSAGALMDSELADIATVKSLTKAGISGSFGSPSSSLSTRVTFLEQGGAVGFTSAGISGSFGAPSASFSTRVTANDAKLTANTSNVTTAGALMDSEVTDLAGIKGVTISTLQPKPSEGAFANGDKTKLDGIEASADVTDTANVTSAGALMDSELAEIATVKLLTKSGISGSFTELSASLSNRAKFTSIWDVVSPSGGQYEFKGPGLTGTENKPALYLTRGEQYQFNINASGHPFYIQTSAGAYSGGNVYSDGITGNGSETGTLNFNVQFDAPTKLYYVCQYHSGMGNIIYIDDFIPETAATASYVAGANVDGAVATATTLATPRAINGVNFDGSAPITVTAAGSTLSDTVTVAKGGTGTTSLTATRVLIGNGTSAITSDSGFTYSSNVLSTEGLTITSTSAQNSEATALMINGSNVVGTRELGSNAFNSTTIGTTTGALTVSTGLNLNSGTTFNGSAARTISVDVSDFMTNGSNNRIVTATGTDAMNAEANLTFDGSILNVKGVITGSSLATNGLISSRELPIISNVSDLRTIIIGDVSGNDDITNIKLNVYADDKIIIAEDTTTIKQPKLTSLSAQNSEATALMINGSNLVGTRELGSNAFNSTTIGTNTNALTVSTGLDLNSGTTFNGSAARTISVDVSDFMTNGSNNRVITATGADAMNAEANLTFDGSTLTLTGVLNIPGFSNVSASLAAAGTGTALTASYVAGANVDGAVATATLAADATTLATPRAINGVNFDGSAPITITAAGSTLSDTVTVAKGGTGATTLGTNQILIGQGTSAVTTDSGFSYASNILNTEGLNISSVSAQSSEATSLMINGDGVVGTRELGSNAFNSTTIGTNTNALTVDNTTVQLNSGTTFNGSAARTLSAKTATIANGGTALATADQIHTFVTGFGYSTLALGTTSTTALAGDTTVGTVVAANPGAGIYDTLERITIGGTSFNIPAGTGNGTVDTSGTPVDNDFAKFTDANTIEGRSAAETKTDLSLNNVENTAISTFAGSANITTVGTIGTGTWNGTAIADAYLSSNTAHLSGTQTFSGAKTFSSLSSFTMDGNTITGIDDSGEFTDDDAHIMTSAGVNDRITSFGYSTTTGTLTGNGSTNRVPIYNGTTSFTTDSGFTYSSNILSTEKLNITAIAATTTENTTIMINGDGETLTRELGSNAYNSTTIGTNTNALTVDNATVQLNSGTTFNGSAARTLSAKTAAIANGGAALATADQIHTFVTTQTDAIDADTSGNAATATLAANSTLAGGLVIGTGRNNSANQIVRTQGNGYAEFGWINTTSGNTTSTITDIYVNTNDGYIRKATNAEFKSQLGIGTNTAALTVSTGLNLNSGTTFNGSAARTISVDVSDFMTNGSNNRIVTATGADAMNAEANLTFDGSNLGIGTTSPDGLLHVSAGTSGDARLILEADTDNNDENDVPQIWFKADGDITEGLIGLNNNYLDFVSNISSTGGFRFFTGTTNNTGTTDPYTNATEKFSITGAGKVGIGTTTPSEMLHVKTTGVEVAKYETTATADLAIELSNSQGSMFFGLGGGEQFGIGTTSDLNGTGNLFIIEQGGNTGIGTTTPTSKFHISDAVNRNMSNTGTGQFQISGNGYQFGIAMGSSTCALYHNSTARTLSLGTNETARLTIAGSSGNTTCTGTLTGTGLFAGSAGKIGADTTDYIAFTNNTRADIYINNSNEFRFESDGDFHADGDVIAQSTTISDSRLKDNILPITGALDKIKSLRGVSYTWNAGKKKDKQDIGLIAQEVEQVIPEIVKDKKMPLMDGIDPDETYKTIDYEKIIAVLVEAVKDQQTQIDNLKKQIKK